MCKRILLWLFLFCVLFGEYSAQAGKQIKTYVWECSRCRCGRGIDRPVPEIINNPRPPKPPSQDCPEGVVGAKCNYVLKPTSVSASDDDFREARRLKEK